MMVMNIVSQILLENAGTLRERNEIFSILENINEARNINNTMISNLYKSAIDKSYVDFEDIPNTDGDITKYSGYNSLIASLNLLKELSTKSNIKIPEIEIVDSAINNIVTYRDSFEKGFKLEKEFIMLQYNTLVLACVEAVSLLISSYVDYVKRPDRLEFVIIKNTKDSAYRCLKNLEMFNKTVKQGDFSKTLNTIIGSGKEGFIGIDDVVIPALIIGAILSIVPITRELIFFFYYSRMKLSDYLKQQAMFIEVNKTTLDSSNLPAKKKNDILKKQEETMKRLLSLSDKIKVNNSMTEIKMSQELSKENKGWKLADIKSQSVSTDDNGFKLL